LPLPRSPLLPYTTLFRSLLEHYALGVVLDHEAGQETAPGRGNCCCLVRSPDDQARIEDVGQQLVERGAAVRGDVRPHVLALAVRSEEHTSELQSRVDLVC